MLPTPSVLIVDPSHENREVLKTALASRGTQIWEAARALEGLALARLHRPDVVVVDLEVTEPAVQAVCDEFQDAVAGRAPIVLLGRARRGVPRDATGQFVPKPYHYGPLVRKIECLLDEARRKLPETA